MRSLRLLETVIYAPNLEEAERFYRDVLGLEPKAKQAGRQLFYQLGEQMLLVFNADVTRAPPLPGAPLPIPPHGADGAGHVCFRATARDIEFWLSVLADRGIAVEADFEWPGGGRSIYFRDPAGNCLEFAEPRIWGLR